MSSLDRGYGDFAMRPDLSTLRLVPWNAGTALLVADLAWEDGSPVVAAPRQILRRQLERLPALGHPAPAGAARAWPRSKGTQRRGRGAQSPGSSPGGPSKTSPAGLGAGAASPPSPAVSATRWRPPG